MELEQLGGYQMFIQIEPESDIPIYAQLASQLIEAIARGKLVGGDALPSVRSLAADLGMNMHTVNKAYHELEKKKSFGLFQSRGLSSIRFHKMRFAGIILKGFP